MTRTTTLALATSLVALSGLTYACASVGASSFDDKLPPTGDVTGGGADAGSFNAPSVGGATPADLAPVDNAVILVHAAKTQSFRLCFSNEYDRRPQPDSQVMPNANVVGVEVGSAVRLGPLKGPPGDVLLFDEPLIRAFYPTFGGSEAGPTCSQLLANSMIGNLAVKLGNVKTDLSRGVHLLVVVGCAANNPLNTYDAADCGNTWTASKGNLSVKEITLPGATRPSPGLLPAQVVNLSQPLDSERAGRDVVVSFGDLVTPGAMLQTVATNPALFPDSQSTAQPAQLQYASTDDAVYASLGFRVTLAAAGGGASSTVLDTSLAQIQKLSSPRDVPTSYYAAASNYALLLLGDPQAKLPDGGADTDARRNVHILAVPVIDPKDDAGVDGGAPTGEPDGGTTPSP